MKNKKHGVFDSVLTGLTDFDLMELMKEAIDIEENGIEDKENSDIYSISRNLMESIGTSLGVTLEEVVAMVIRSIYREAAVRWRGTERAELHIGKLAVTNNG